MKYVFKGSGTLRFKQNVNFHYAVSICGWSECIINNSYFDNIINLFLKYQLSCQEIFKLFNIFKV